MHYIDLYRLTVDKENEQVELAIRASEWKVDLYHMSQEQFEQYMESRKLRIESHMSMRFDRCVIRIKLTDFDRLASDYKLQVK